MGRETFVYIDICVQCSCDVCVQDLCNSCDVCVQDNATFVYSYWTFVYGFAGAVEPRIIALWEFDLTIITSWAPLIYI